MPFIPRTALLCWVLVSFCITLRADWDAGPLYDEFPLTLATGHRHEALGPVWQHQEQDTETLWAVPPLFSYVRDTDLELAEMDILYPLLSLDRYGAEYRFHILQFLAFSGGQDQEEEGKRRFTIFPFYFQQRSEIPGENYTALLPIYGRMKNRLFRDEIKFVLMPLYVQSRKRDVVTDNYLYPFFHLRHGNELHGWQFWPIIGMEHRNPTTRTNSIEEVEVVGGHDKMFVLWPFFSKQTTGIGTDNPERQISFLPLFTSTHSPKRDSMSAPWPIGLTRTYDREKQFKEIGAPWPLVVFARGEGKHMSRVWPLYSRAHSTNLQSSFYLWPVYRYNRLHSDPLDRERTRILFFLYSAVNEKNTETGIVRKRRDFWPFYTYQRDFSGNERFQALALLEPLLPNNKSIERNYSPIWSIWRSEKNGKTGAQSQSLLWNFYRLDKTTESTKTSLFFGLFQRQKSVEGSSWRVFYIPFGGDRQTNELRTARNGADIEHERSSPSLPDAGGRRGLGRGGIY
jgi:hypothetical protein